MVWEGGGIEEREGLEGLGGGGLEMILEVICARLTLRMKLTISFMASELSSSYFWVHCCAISSWSSSPSKTESTAPEKSAIESQKRVNPPCANQTKLGMTHCRDN